MTDHEFNLLCGLFKDLTKKLGETNKELTETRVTIAAAPEKISQTINGKVEAHAKQCGEVRLLEGRISWWKMALLIIVTSGLTGGISNAKEILLLIQKVAGVL